MKYHIQLVFLVCINIILNGCSSTGGQITSFEDLTTESSKEGWSKVPQYRVISIPGLLPFSDIGGVHFYKARRKPSSAIGLSNTASSYIVERTINGSCDMSCLAKVRDKIMQVKVAGANLVEDKVNLTRMRSKQLSSDASDEDKKRYQKNLKAVYDQYAKTRVDLDSKHKKAVESITNNGVLVFRWNTGTKKSGAFGLGSIFGGSASIDETQSGFGLVSGLKLSTLYIGNDIMNVWGRINTKYRYSNRFEITTYAMQAEHIMYMSEYDLSSALGTKLKASYSQLANAGDTLKQLDNIEIEAALSKVSNLSNIGVIGASKSNIIIIDWSRPGSIGMVNRNDGWQTIYAVKSDLEDLLDMISKLW